MTKRRSPRSAGSRRIFAGRSRPRTGGITIESHEGETSFRAIFERSLDAITINRFDDGRYVDVNPAFERVTDWSREEVVGRTPMELGLWPAKRELIDFLKELAREGSLSNRRFELLSKRGEPLPWNYSATIIQLGGEAHILTIGRDETGIRRGEEAQALLASLVSCSNDAIYSTDPDGIITSWNDAAERLFGYRADEIIGKSAALLNPGGPEELKKRIASLRRDGKAIVDLEARRVRKGGELLEVSRTTSPLRDSSGEIIGFSVIVRDIGERKRGERALRESEEKFRTLFENNLDSVTISDIETGRYTDVNPEALSAFGYAREEVIGRTPMELQLWADTEAFTVFVQEIVSGRRVQNQEVILRDKHGRDLHYLVSASVIELLGRKHVLGMARNITEAVSQREEIRRLNTDLERRVAERTAELESLLHELEAFSYTVAHDLKAPARALISFASLLERRHSAELSVEAADCLREIRENAKKMNAFLDDLLTLARIRTLEPRKSTVELAELVREVLADLRLEYAERAVDFKLGGLPAVEGDPVVIRHILLNLIANALKFTRERSPAIIEIDSVEEAGERAYFVRDNGIGFDMRHAARLFGIFERLHANPLYEGSGAGLAIVKRLVDRHGGRVWAQAQEGRGATFYFTLRGGTAAAGALG